MIVLYAIGLFFLSLAAIYLLFEIFDEVGDAIHRFFKPYRKAKVALRKAWWRHRYGTDKIFDVAAIRNNLVEGSDGQYRDSKGNAVIIAVYLDSWEYTLQWDKPPVLREYR